MRQAEFGGFARVVHETVDELLLGRVLPEIDEHGGRVTVEHRHADALRGDAQRAFERNNLAGRVIDVAEDLERLLLGFRFFARDVRDNVADHFRPVLEGLAGAGNRLIRADDDLVRLEFLPCGESRRIRLD